MANMTTRSHYASTAILSATCVLLLNSACAVELIDSIIAERGVTECTTSGSGEHDTTDTALSTSTDDTSGPDNTTGMDTSTSSLSGSTTTEIDGSTTDSVPSVCGDGIVEGEETCDDGNQTPGDGCQECAKDSIVFVSSEVYQGFALEGLYGADQRCRSLAGKASLARHLTFKAWLSSSKESAAARLIQSKGRYVLVNGLVVAENWSGLTTDTLINPIMVDEASQSRDDAVWTGTLSSGESAFNDEFCEDWDDDSGLLKFAGVGFSSSVDATWSFFEPAPCDSELRLYCIEQ